MATPRSMHNQIRRRAKGNHSHLKRRFVLEQLEDRRLLAAGDLDLTFGTSGLVTTDFSATAALDDQANGIAVQQDGRLVVVGSTLNAYFSVARYNTNGSLDTSFSGDGKLTTDFSVGVADSAQRVAIDVLGRLVVVGQSGTDFAIARYLSDGTLDANFGSGGKVTTDFGGDDGIVGVAIDANDRIVVGGFSQQSNGRDIALARYNSNGSLDTTFGIGGKVLTNISATDAMLDLKLDGQGRIVGAGYSVRPGSTDFDFTLVRYNTNGSLDTSLHGDGIQTLDFNQGNDVARSLSIDNQGRLVLSGDNPFDFAIARFLPDGTLDNSFAGDGTVTTDFGNTTDRGYWGSGIDVEGNIVIGGYSSQLRTQDDFALARYRSDGSLDTRFGSNGIVTTDFGRSGPDFGLNMALQADGKIVLVGQSYRGTTGYDFAVARYESGIVVASPGFTITPTSGLITSESSGAASFTAVLNTQPTANVTFRMVSSDSSEGVVSPSSLTFSPSNWNIPQTVTVTGVDDLTVDGDISYFINTANAVSNDPNYNALNPVDVSVTNRDNDTPTLTLSIAAASISEGAGPSATTATLSRNSNSTSALSVTVSSSDPSEATVPVSVTIPAGQTSVTFPISAVDDTILDGSQIVTVTASSTGFVAGIRDLVVTDNDVAGFTVSGANSLLAWSGSGASGVDPFGVAYSTTPNHIKPSWGMPGFGAGTTVFKAPGSFEAFRVTFSGLPTGVNIAGGDYNTVLNVTPFGTPDLWNNSVNGNSILFTSPDPATKRLDQNDPFFVSVIFTGTFDANSLTFDVEYIGSPGLTVSESGTTKAFDVRLDAQPSSDVEISVSSGDSSEVTVDKSVLIFTPANWNLPQTVRVAGVDDSIIDGDQTTSITLSIDDAKSDDRFDLLVDQIIQVVTEDNDGLLSLTIDKESIIENAGAAAATATVTRSGNTNSALTVTLFSDDTTEATVPPTVTIPAGQSTVQFAIGAVDDAIVDGIRTVTITASAENFTDGSNVVFVADDDTAGITVTPISGNTTEAGGTVNFTVVLTSEPTSDVVIGISSSDTSEGTVSASNLTFSAANWNLPQTVTVSGVDDLFVDGNIGFSVIVAAAISSDSMYAGRDPADQPVINLDNDEPITNSYFPIDGRLISGGTAYNLGREPIADPFSAVVLRVSDGVTQSITEGEALVTGGKKPKVGSALDYYQWSFGAVVDVTAFRVQALRTVNSESDNFRFEYSLNGGNWVSLATVTTATSQSYDVDLSASPLSGNLVLRVVDTDRSPAAQRTTPALDSVRVDSLYFSSVITDLRPRVEIVALDSSAAESPLDNGQFRITREGTAGDLQVFYSIGGSAVAGTDYAPLTGMATIAAGQSMTTITVTPTNDSLAEGNETVIVTILNSDNYSYKVGINPSAIVTIADDDLRIFKATAENTVSGSIISNNFNATFSSDGVVETIQETQSGGKPSDRTSFVDHRWTFSNVSGANSFYLTASRPNNLEGDNFEFQYSLNSGSTWTSLATVSTSVLTQYPVALPFAISGTVLVRVVDTNRNTAGNGVRDTVSIDQLVFSNAPLLATGAPSTTQASMLIHASLDSVSRRAITIDSGIRSWVIDLGLYNFEKETGEVVVAPNSFSTNSGPGDDISRGKIGQRSQGTFPSTASMMKASPGREATVDKVIEALASELSSRLHADLLKRSKTE